MGAATYGGKGFKERARVSGERPIGVPAADCDNSFENMLDCTSVRCFYVCHFAIGSNSTYGTEKAL